jgi:hypothetical protein
MYVPYNKSNNFTFSFLYFKRASYINNHNRINKEKELPINNHNRINKKKASYQSQF